MPIVVNLIPNKIVFELASTMSKQKRMRDQNEEDLNNYKTKMIAEDITSANVPSAAMTDTVLENNSAATTKIPSLKAITDNNSINAAAPATTEEAIKALEGIGSPKNSLQDQDNQGEGQGQDRKRQSSL